MIVADILEVPISSKNNCYLLVIQDYHTKWTEAIHLPDQKAVTYQGAIQTWHTRDPTLWSILKALFWFKPWMHLALASPVQPPTTLNVMGW